MASDLKKSLQKKGCREKYLAVVTAALILCVILYISIVEPPLAKRKKHIEFLQQQELKLLRMKHDLLLKDKIEKTYTQIQSIIASKGTEQREVSLFAREVSNLYSKLNVKIRSVKILSTTEEDFYRRLALKVEMYGPVEDVLKFILAVEGNTKAMRIEQFNLTPKEGENTIQSSLTISKVVANSKT